MYICMAVKKWDGRTCRFLLQPREEATGDRGTDGDNHTRNHKSWRDRVGQSGRVPARRTTCIRGTDSTSRRCGFGSCRRGRTRGRSRDGDGCNVQGALWPTLNQRCLAEGVVSNYKLCPVLYKLGRIEGSDPRHEILGKVGDRSTDDALRTGGAGVGLVEGLKEGRLCRADGSRREVDG